MKRASSVLTAAAAVLAAAWACDDPTFSDPSLLAISTSVEPDSAIPGDMMWITVTAKNPTQRVLRYEYLTCRGGFGYTVLTADGDRAGGIRRMCISLDVVDGFEPGTRLLRLGPGEVAEQRFGWNPVHDYYRYGLQPGEYEIVGWFQGDSRAESEPEDVRVLPLLPLDIESLPAVATVGETVVIRVGLTNASSEAADIPVFSSCGFGVWIKHADRAIEMLTECVSPDPSTVVQPGQRIEGFVEWLPPESGDYEIFVQLVWSGQAGAVETSPLRVQ